MHPCTSIDARLHIENDPPSSYTPGMSVQSLILLASVGRVLLGFAPIVGASQSARLLGFPEEHDNATARLMARLFGVRDIGLGVIGFAAVAGTVPATFALLFNAATDAADALMIAIPLARRQGIDRAATTSLVFACIGGATWLLAYALL